MKKFVLFTISGLFLFILFISIGNTSADDHEHGHHYGKKNGHEHRRDKSTAHSYDDVVPAVEDSQYSDACGMCHFAYQPAFLPSRSWEAILNMQTHFGQQLPFNEDEMKTIKRYLTGHAADQVHSELAEEFTESSQGFTPLRITEVPEWQEEHEDIAPEVFSRKSIGGRGNCSACHPKAAKGIYEDDQVSIPDQH